MLVLLLRRLKRTRDVTRIVVATSTEASDDPVAAVAEDAGCEVFRGPLEDVLGRFVGAVTGFVGPVVRITADCPLVDPDQVDLVVRAYLSNPACDYASNVEPRVVPDGLDVEVVTADVLRKLDRELGPGRRREHVTAAIREHLREYVTCSVPGDTTLAQLRWTVDDAADLEFVRRLVSLLGPRRDLAGLEEILSVVRGEPSLLGFGGHRRG